MLPELRFSKSLDHSEGLRTFTFRALHWFRCLFHSSHASWETGSCRCTSKSTDKGRRICMGMAWQSGTRRIGCSQVLGAWVLLCGVRQVCFLMCPLFEKHMSSPPRPTSASSFPTPLMSADEDQPVQSLEWGLSPNRAAELDSSWGEIVLISSFWFPLETTWPFGWLSQTQVTGWADFFVACVVNSLRTPWVRSCMGAVAPRTWQTQPDLTWSLFCNKKRNLGIQLSLRGIVVTKRSWSRIL